MRSATKTYWWAVFAILLLGIAPAMADFTVFPVVENMSADHKDFYDGVVVFRNYSIGIGGVLAHTGHHELSTTFGTGPLRLWNNKWIGGRRSKDVGS